MATAISRIRSGGHPRAQVLDHGYVSTAALYPLLTKLVGTCAEDRQLMRDCTPECSCPRCRLERGLLEAERAAAEIEANDAEQREALRLAEAEEERRYGNRPEPIYCDDCHGTGEGFAGRNCRKCGGGGVADRPAKCDVDIEAELAEAMAE